MDRDLEYLETAPALSWLKVGLAGVGSILILVVSSFFIRTCPSEGYRAGYGAAIAQGRAWVEAAVEFDDGLALRACDELHGATAHSVATDYSDFVDGCSKGIDQLSGRHIPLVAAPR